MKLIMRFFARRFKRELKNQLRRQFLGSFAIRRTRLTNFRTSKGSTLSAFVVCVMVGSGTLMTNSVQGGPIQFSLSEMPEGGEVTVPQAATTLVPGGSQVQLDATDQPQTIRIAPSPNAGMLHQGILLNIDDGKGGSKKVKLSPKTPFLYSFRGLSTVMIRGDGPCASPQSAKSCPYVIESDKPLTVKVIKF